jgi:hypothetical protein
MIAAPLVMAGEGTPSTASPLPIAKNPWTAGLRPSWRRRVNINANEYYYRRHGYQFTPGSAFRRYLAF